jgi:uncharacterized protein YjiS (DUF1127 family)
MSDFTMFRLASAQPVAGRAGKENLVARLRAVLRTYVTRRMLPELTPRELADIGLSASAALAEASRLPWDTAPTPRRDGPGIMSNIRRGLERARTRRLLSRLQMRELRDIGASPSDAQAEAAKPFWKP